MLIKIKNIDMCSIMLPPNIDIDAIEKSINNSVFKISKEVAVGGKQIKMIYKQHRVNEAAYAGEGWFDESGKYSSSMPSLSFKFKVCYTNKINNTEHIWCFN